MKKKARVKALVIGNGESRKQIDLNLFKLIRISIIKFLILYSAYLIIILLFE